MTGTSDLIVSFVWMDTLNWTWVAVCTYSQKLKKLITDDCHIQIWADTITLHTLSLWNRYSLRLRGMKNCTVAQGYRAIYWGSNCYSGPTRQRTNIKFFLNLLFSSMCVPNKAVEAHWALYSCQITCVTSSKLAEMSLVNSANHVTWLIWMKYAIIASLYSQQ
jgi:hypothetical protein